MSVSHQKPMNSYQIPSPDGKKRARAFHVQ